MNAVEFGICIVVALTLTAFSYFALGYPSASAPTQAHAPAKCPPGWRVGDPGATYWQVHTRGHGWSKWHCRPYPHRSFKDAS